MNKKFTPRLIKMICSECLMLIVAISVVGGAMITHQEFKATAQGETKTQVAESTTKSTPKKDSEQKSDTSQNNTTSKISTSPETTTAATVNEDYEYAYAGFNPTVIDTTVDISKILLNKNYILPDGYTPQLAPAIEGSDVELDYRVAPYYQAMYDAALEDGITLTPLSGYRSIERQRTNLEARISNIMTEEDLDKTEATIEATKIIMLPGASEHNAGLAMDICSLADNFEYTDEYAWLTEHAAEYGFILRYPKSEEKQKITGVVFEPWHYRFVGVEVAKEITRRGITLEEYLGKVN